MVVTSHTYNQEKALSDLWRENRSADVGTDLASVIDAARILAQSLKPDVEVIFAGIKVADTDRKVIRIPASLLKGQTNPVPGHIVDIILGTVVHEMGHVLYSDDRVKMLNKIMSATKPVNRSETGRIELLTGVMEDIRIDHVMSLYPCYADYLHRERANALSGFNPDSVLNPLRNQCTRLDMINAVIYFTLCGGKYPGDLKQDNVVIMAKILEHTMKLVMNKSSLATAVANSWRELKKLPEKLTKQERGVEKQEKSKENQQQDNSTQQPPETDADTNESEPTSNQSDAPDDISQEDTNDATGKPSGEPDETEEPDSKNDDMESGDESGEGEDGDNEPGDEPEDGDAPGESDDDRYEPDEDADDEQPESEGGETDGDMEGDSDSDDSDDNGADTDTDDNGDNSGDSGDSGHDSDEDGQGVEDTDGDGEEDGELDINPDLDLSSELDKNVNDQTELSQNIAQQVSDAIIEKRGDMTQMVQLLAKDSHSTIISYTPDEGAESVNNARMESSMVEEQLRRVIQNYRLKRTAYYRGLRSGSISSRRLYRAGYGDDRVFQSRTRPDEVNAHLLLLMDLSGSMGKYQGLIYQIVTASCDAFSKEKVEFTAMGYSNEHTKVYIPRLYDIETGKVNLGLNHEWGSTPSYEGLAAAIAQLLRLSGNKKKVLVHFTDGGPNYGSSPMIPGLLKMSREKGIIDFHVTTAAMRSSFNQLYGDNVEEISTIEQLPDVMDAILNKILVGM